ncbi:MAG: PIG-L family deacetylase [Chloroflexi bacterium]|nr:PIG-L family deacetylase [Chloroflexota bacterium]
MTTMTPTLLAVFAHPDDETFLAGPLLARYAGQGIRVEVACATPLEPALSDRSDWDYRHRQALFCAAEALGLQGVHFLGYDGAPMGPIPNAGQRMVAAAPLSQVAGAIGRVMDDLQPDAVITDSPYGAYGHPDHIVVHWATVEAFQKHKKAGARLYCLALPLPLVRLNLRLMALRLPVHGLGPHGHIDLAAAVKTAPEKTALVDTRGYVRCRRTAARCYAEEIAGAPLPLKLLEWSPLWVQRLVFRRTALTRLYPPVRPGEQLERDIFASHSG